MKRALAALTLLFAFLLCFAGTASAYVDHGAKNRVGIFGEHFDPCAPPIGLLPLEPQQENTILCYDTATGVLFYVRQNPWTFFDPLGLSPDIFAPPVQILHEDPTTGRISGVRNYDNGAVEWVGDTPGGDLPANGIEVAALQLALSTGEGKTMAYKYALGVAPTGNNSGTGKSFVLAVAAFNGDEEAMKWLQANGGMSPTLKQMGGRLNSSPQSGFSKNPVVRPSSTSSVKGAEAIPKFSPQRIVNEYVANPKSMWGKSAKTIADNFNAAGYKATVVKSTRGSGRADIVRVEGHPEIQQVQVHPGGGRHGGKYVKVSTSNKGIRKVVDPETYKETPGEKAEIIPYSEGGESSK